MNMGIGKGKSDKIDIDGLIEGVGNENKVAQEESKLEQKIKELKDVRLELEAATRKMEEVTFALKTATDSADNIISGICRAIVKAEQNIVFRAKISTDELAKVHQCTVRHIKAEEDLLERHSDKTMFMFPNLKLINYISRYEALCIAFYDLHVVGRQTKRR